MKKREIFNIQEQLTEYETSVLAKDKGFNELCYSFYQSEDCLLKDCFEYNSSYKYYNSEYKPSPDNPEWFLANACSAPTQSLLQKWLREVHNIHIQIHFLNNSYLVKIKYFEKETIKELYIKKYSYKTFEEALEVALVESLKLVKS